MAFDMFDISKDTNYGLTPWKSKSGEYTPVTAKLSKGGDALQKSLWDTTKQQYAGGIMPTNLASQYMGEIKRGVMNKYKDDRAGLRASAAGSGGVMTGAQAQGAIDATGNYIGGMTEPGLWKADNATAEKRAALKNFNSFRNMELNVPVTTVQNAWQSANMYNQQKADQGQAMGGMIKMAAVMASDERVKDNIKPIENALEKIMELDGKTYNYITDKEPNGGIIAQDLEKVLPEAVVEIDGIKHVNYTAVIALLVNAVKELAKRQDKE